MLSIERLRSSGCATVTIKEAAELVGVDPRTLNGALTIHGGDIPARRIGRRVVIPREAFLSWFDGSTVERAAPATVVTEDTTVTAVRAKLIELLGALESTV